MDFKLDIKDAAGLPRKLFGFLRNNTSDEIISTTSPIDKDGNEISFAKNQNVLNYNVLTSGTGYSAGNLLVLFQIYNDKTDTVTLKWYNSTTNAILTSAPTPAHIELLKTTVANFPTTQAVSISGNITEVSAEATKTAAQSIDTRINVLNGKIDTLNGKIDTLNTAVAANSAANELLAKHMRMNEFLLCNLLGKGFNYDDIQKTINTDSNF
jgi:hypothetical protein